MSGRIYTVSEVNALVRELLEGDDRLRELYVRGEVSNYKVYPSGHHYFTVKDGEATLRAVMFRREASRLRFRPENGMKVIVFGRIGVYPRDGAYQLYAAELSPDGVGDLHVAFEQLKAKLLQEGLFDQAHKRPLPPYPERIAVVTSGAGAAVRDIIRVAVKRWPLAKLLILPVRVQGTEAPPEIVSAIRFANRHRLADVIITGRGGGSIEDLWAFNDERVARAIYASEIPVISAVGHEPDVTISDFVADLRAATPSNAAELAVPDRADMSVRLASLQRRMETAMSGRIAAERLRLKRLGERRVLQAPEAYLDELRLTLDRVSDRLCAAQSALIAARRTAFASRAAALDAMSPLKVLGRGYAIASGPGGRLVRSSRDVQPGDRLQLRLSEGSVECRVLSGGESMEEDRHGG